MPGLSEVLDIFLTIILPVFVLIGVGVLLDRLLSPDLPTLSQLNFYVFVPALVFVKILESDLDLGASTRLAGAGFTLLGVLYLGAWLLCRRIPWLKPHDRVVPMSCAFYNAGNYGIPFAHLAFGKSGVAAMAVILMVQNLGSFTLGVCALEGKRGIGRLIGGLLTTPVILAIALAVALRGLGLQPPSQLSIPLGHLADGLIPIALLTLGVQLSRSEAGQQARPLMFAVVVRLIVAPAAALGIALAFGLREPERSVFVAAAGLPTAVNVFILASRYDEDPELASRTVFVTTLLSAATMAVLLTLLRR